jgi:hypothetical protein
MLCANFSAKPWANIGSSEDPLCSARSTVAIKLSISVPVNVIFNIPIFSSRTRPCSVFLGRSRKTPPQSFFQNLYPARLTITAPGARQFLRGKPKLRKLNSEPTQTFSATRIFALRDRGLRSISSSDAITGFFVSKRKCLSFAPSRIASLTILSSSE